VQESGFLLVVKWPQRRDAHSCIVHVTRKAGPRCHGIDDEIASSSGQLHKLEVSEIAISLQFS
jgi:hypothetical protein